MGPLPHWYIGESGGTFSLLQIPLLDLRDLRHPECRGRIGGHSPTASGGDTHVEHGGAVGEAGALELLGEEAAGEGLQPLDEGGIVVSLAQGVLRHMEQLGGGEAVAEEVVEIEVVKLVGTHQVLGLLGDVTALVGGKQLGADGSTQNVVEGFGQLVLPCLPLAVGGVGHQVAYQGLGDAAVDAVHGHMVAVVGRPTQGQLGEVTRTDYHTAHVVGDVHDDLGALAGLGVLVGHVADGGIMADVLEVLIDRIENIHGAEVHPQLLAEDGGVGLGADGGTEAGHGHRHDVGTGTTQQVHGPNHDQEGQGRIQSARNTQNDLFRPGGGDALLETVGLDGQDALAGVGAEDGVGGGEGVSVDETGQLGVLHAEVEVILGDLPAGRGIEIADAAVVGDALQVQLGDGERLPIGKGCALGQDAAALGHDGVTAVDVVGGGLPCPAVSQQVGAEAAGGLPLDGHTAVFLGSHDLGGSRGIADHGSSRGDQTGGGRVGCEQIAAHLHTKAEGGEAVADEHLLGAQLGEATVAHPVNGEVLGRGRGKDTALGGGEAGLGDQTQDHTARHHGGAVVDLIGKGHGQAHHADQVAGGGILGKALQGLHGPPKKAVVAIEVAAGGPRQAKFGKGQHLDSQIGGLDGQRGADGGVMGGVGHLDSGCGCGDLDESVLHVYTSFPSRGGHGYILYYYSRLRGIYQGFLGRFYREMGKIWV